MVKQIALKVLDFSMKVLWELNIFWGIEYILLAPRHKDPAMNEKRPCALNKKGLKLVKS